MLNNTHFKQNCRSGCLTTFAVRLYVNYKNVHGYNICILWYFSMKFCSCNHFDALFICKAVGSKWILGGGGGGGWQQWKPRGVWGHAPPDNFKTYNPRNTITSILGSDILQKSALQIRSLGMS